MHKPSARDGDTGRGQPGTCAKPSFCNREYQANGWATGLRPSLAPRTSMTWKIPALIHRGTGKDADTEQGMRKNTTV